MKKIYIKRNDLFKGINLLLCNNIISVDENFIEDNYELFYDDCDDCDGTGEKDGKHCDNCSGEGRHNSEPYQYFLCRANEYDIENLKSYGVDLGYSNKLDLHVLPIYDYGTSWDCFSYSKEVEDDYTLAYNETVERTTVY